MSAPIIHAITRRPAGLGGHLTVTADVEYPDEPRCSLTFDGSTLGGPVVMRTADAETFVTNPDRFGSFGPDWVRRFIEAA